jgi:hypothetical protein
MMLHCIQFELANFHGAHRHVITAEPNLAASDDPHFNNTASSIVIYARNCEFFADADFKTKIGNTLGPGVYPFVANVGIKNGAISSLRLVR